MSVSLSDDIDYATSIAGRAMQHMADNRIPPTPDNFSVWSRYAAGTSPALTKAIDIIAGNKRAFDAATNRDLFRAYVGAQPDADDRMVLASDQIGALMSAARGFLNTTINDNRAHVRALGDMSAEANAGADARQLVEGLIAALSTATVRASTMEANFSEASRELDTIRTSLQKAEEQSRTDTLTGLANRRALDEFFRQAQIDAMEQGTPLSVMMIDIDHFKRFNDSFGHQIGDQVLRLVANVLREQVRDHDLVARYGGEEMICVLPGASLQVCRGVAERIRLAISQRRIRRRTTGEEISAITVSVGVAEFQPGETQDSVTERCDAALYRAKHSGRNMTMTEADLAKDGVAA
jgi:diguanylate cyclase